MFNKRGVVSITTFSLIILILLIVLSFSYEYYIDSKSETNLIVKEQELQYSIGSFRSELISILSSPNTTLEYENIIDSTAIEIMLTNESIKGYTIFENKQITANISTLGMKFCSNYTFSPNAKTNFYYNGACISIE